MSATNSDTKLERKAIHASTTHSSAGSMGHAEIRQQLAAAQVAEKKRTETQASNALLSFTKDLAAFKDIAVKAEFFLKNLNLIPFPKTNFFYHDPGDEGIRQRIFALALGLSETATAVQILKKCEKVRDAHQSIREMCDCIMRDPIIKQSLLQDVLSSTRETAPLIRAQRFMKLYNNSGRRMLNLESLPDAAFTLTVGLKADDPCGHQMILPYVKKMRSETNGNTEITEVCDIIEGHFQLKNAAEQREAEAQERLRIMLAQAEQRVAITKETEKSQAKVAEKTTQQYRLGLSPNAILSTGSKEFFYGMQIRMHWAISKQKVYLGMIALYGSFRDSNYAQSYGSPGQTFALIPLSFIYVF